MLSVFRTWEFATSQVRPLAHFDQWCLLYMAAALKGSRLSCSPCKDAARD